MCQIRYNTIVHDEATVVTCKLYFVQCKEWCSMVDHGHVPGELITYLHKQKYSVRDSTEDYETCNDRVHSSDTDQSSLCQLSTRNEQSVLSSSCHPTAEPYDWLSDKDIFTCKSQGNRGLSFQPEVSEELTYEFDVCSSDDLLQTKTFSY